MARIEYKKQNDADRPQYTIYPRGTYDLQVVSMESGASSKGNPQLTVKCEIADGDFAGKKVTLWLSQLPQSAWRLQSFIDALGINYEETGGDEIAFDTDDVAGCYFRAECSQKQYNGKDKNDWENFTPSPLGEPDAAQAAPPTAAPLPAPAGRAMASSPQAAAPQAQPTVERRSRRLT